MSKPPPVFQIGDFKTLPLYLLMGRLKEDLRPFDRATVRIEYKDPDYDPCDYAANAEWLEQTGDDGNIAIKVVKEWPDQVGKSLYYIQFKDDTDHNWIRSLRGHTELVSVICDARLGIDTSVLWAVFDGTYQFDVVHREYRADVKREEKYGEYAANLERVWTQLSERRMEADQLILRLVRQIELRGRSWSKMIPLTPRDQSESDSVARTKVRLFYSYSHKDEQLRDQLETHLSLLKRQGIIEAWHDRRIGPGKEWENQIDSHLEAARVILLLVSADFLASDYCWDVELKRV